MNAVLMFVREKGRTPIGLSVIVLFGLACAVFAFVPRTQDVDEENPEQRLFIKAKRAVNGQKIKLDHDEEEYLMLAGIRAPVGGEPFYDQAVSRLTGFVEDKKIRLRFDDEKRDSEARLLGYAFVDDTFVNEVLVREGLAYARITTQNDRFGDRLRAAQAEAQKARRGIWATRKAGTETSYVGDRKYGNFHRRSCEEAEKIPADRVTSFTSDKNALEKGFAPCAKCKP